MEKFRPIFEPFNEKRPTIRQIFDAKTSYETMPDWDAKILTSADPKDIKKVDAVLHEGLPLGEAEIILGIYKKES